MLRILLIALVGVTVATACSDAGESTATSQTTTEQATTPSETALVVVDPAGDWDPILATTRAKEAPTAASCPVGTDANSPGPSNQEHPTVGHSGNGPAAFDRHTGRVVYVDALGETWTFDVCTNTWEGMNPTGTVGELGSAGGLVYDADSDVTIALGERGIAVYDATANTWTTGADIDASGMASSPEPWGVTYDPVSGLVLARASTRNEDNSLWAYDVDTDTWTRVGTLPAEVPQLIGYVADSDRLVFQSYTTAVDPVGAVVDPRTGQSASIEGPEANMAGGFGLSSSGTDATTTYFQDDDGAICAFDSAAAQWTTCLDASDSGVRYYRVAIVGDLINDRLVLIPNGLPANTVGAIWAIDPDNGATTQLVADGT